MMLGPTARSTRAARRSTIHQGCSARFTVRGGGRGHGETARRGGHPPGDRARRRGLREIDAEELQRPGKQPVSWDDYLAGEALKQRREEKKNIAPRSWLWDEAEPTAIEAFASEAAARPVRLPVPAQTSPYVGVLAQSCASWRICGPMTWSACMVRSCGSLPSAMQRRRV